MKRRSAFTIHRLFIWHVYLVRSYAKYSIFWQAPSNIIHLKVRCFQRTTYGASHSGAFEKHLKSTANWVLEHLIGNRQQETLKHCYFFLFTFFRLRWLSYRTTMLIFLQGAYLYLVTCEFLLRGGSSQDLTGKFLLHFVIDSHLSHYFFM